MVAIANDRDTFADVPCFNCSSVYVLHYNRQDMMKWLDGSMLIQDAMPYLTAGERELLLSNICDTCFDNMFPALDNSKDE